jgi:tetratricopeptide (TPR) repeat protein
MPALTKPRSALFATTILLATVIAYLPAFRAGFIWDDDAYVTENPTLHDFDGLRRIWFEIGATDQYYPLVFTTFWIEQQIWGLAPLGYHAVNILLHATSAILVWLILRRLDVPGAVFAALLFAQHPVHVESVAWVTERKNVLSGILYLASLLWFLRHAYVPSGGKGRWYALTLLSFAGALLSKTVTATLPVVLLLLLWWKHGRVRKHEFVATLPMFVLGGLAALVTIWVERHHVGTKHIDWNLTAVDRALVAGRAVWFYLGKLVWPVELTFIYPRWQIPGAPAWHFVAPAGVIGLGLLTWIMRKRFGNGPFVAFAYFVITLLPALGFIDVYPMRYSFVADHFQYLASLGPLALVAALAARLPLRRESAGIGGGLVLVALATLTWRQCGIYRDAETLWRDTIAKNPAAWMAHGNLAAELAKRGRVDDAMHYYREGLRLKDDAPQVHFALAELLQRNGLLDDAIKHYRYATRINPRYAEAHNNLALCLAGMDRGDEALEHYEVALALKPDYAEAHGNLANLLLHRGDLEGAVRHGRRAAEFNPDNPYFHFNLATALMRHSKRDEAAAHFSESIRLLETMLRSNPRDGQAQRALQLARQALESR